MEKAETLAKTERKNCTVRLSSVLEKGRGFLFVRPISRSSRSSYFFSSIPRILTSDKRVQASALCLGVRGAQSLDTAGIYHLLPNVNPFRMGFVFCLPWGSDGLNQLRVIVLKWGRWPDLCFNQPRVTNVPHRANYLSAFVYGLHAYVFSKSFAASSGKTLTNWLSSWVAPLGF